MHPQNVLGTGEVGEKFLVEKKRGPTGGHTSGGAALRIGASPWGVATTLLLLLPREI